MGNVSFPDCPCCPCPDRLCKCCQAIQLYLTYSFPCFGITDGLLPLSSAGGPGSIYLPPPVEYLLGPAGRCAYGSDPPVSGWSEVCDCTVGADCLGLAGFNLLVRLPFTCVADNSLEIDDVMTTLLVRQIITDSSGTSNCIREFTIGASFTSSAAFNCTDPVDITGNFVITADTGYIGSCPETRCCSSLETIGSIIGTFHITR